MDLISDLPDDILIKIMSSLSTKDAIKTSALCSGWMNMWKGVSNVQIDCGDILNFLDGCSPPDWSMDIKFWAVRERILKLLSTMHSSKISKLEIAKISNVSLHGRVLVNSVAEFCLDHHVEDLTLDFEPSYELLMYLSCNLVSQIGSLLKLICLTRLCLNGCQLVLFPFPSKRPLMSSSLKTLVLSNVLILSEDFKDLISRCPSLTSLFLHNIYSGVVTINHSKLRHLRIQVYALLQINTPSLEVLEFPDFLSIPRRVLDPPWLGIIFEDVSSVIKCKFQTSMDFEREMLYCELMWRSLYCLRHAKTIRLDHHFVKGLASCPPPKTTLEALSFRKLKLALKDDTGIHVESVAKALTFFPRIEKLTVLMEENCCLLSRTKCWWRDLERTLSGMQQLKDISLRDFLRVSDELRHANKKHRRSTFKVEFKIIQIMMQSIKNLEKLTIHVSRDMPKRVPMNFMSILWSRFDRIRNLPRASPSATLILVYV